MSNHSSKILQKRLADLRLRIGHILIRIDLFENNQKSFIRKRECFFSIVIALILLASLFVIIITDMVSPDVYIFAGAIYALTQILIDFTNKEYQLLLKSVVGGAALALILIKDLSIFIGVFEKTWSILFC